MKRQRIVLAVVVAAIVQALMLLAAPHLAAEEEGDDTILDAYMKAPEVAAAIESFREDGYADRGARSMLVSSVCGVAGCSHEYLVVHLFSYGGTNPQDRSILARVNRMTFGDPRVEIVVLTPKREPPHIKPRVLDKRPAPRPQGSEEPREPQP
jgi:hypothetical protein